MKRLPYLILTFIVTFVLMGVSRCATVKIDPAMGADEGNDYSIVLSGYGTRSQKGYLFIQIAETASVEDDIVLTFPKALCKQDACVRYQFFRKDGSLGTGGSVLRGTTQARIRLAEVVGHMGFAGSTDEGEYSVSARVYFMGPDGQETSSISHGFVRVNVLNKNYRAMVCDDPDTAWTQKMFDNCDVKFTSKLRSVLCGAGCT